MSPTPTTAVGVNEATRMTPDSEQFGVSKGYSTHRAGFFQIDLGASQLYSLCSSLKATHALVMTIRDMSCTGYVTRLRILEWSTLGIYMQIILL